MAAAAAFRAGDFKAAEAGYTEALDQAEDAETRAGALSNRAQCRLKLGRSEEAREDAAAARALAPENVKAWYRLGLAEARLDKLPEASAALEQALALRPGDADVAAALTSVRRRQAEASGRYAWPEVYSWYLKTGELAVQAQKAKESKDAGQDVAGEGTPSPMPGTAAEAEELVIASLGVEPYVGPVRVGLSEGKGRGLFVTEDVPAGRLLLCAQALATGLNEDLPGHLQRAAARSSEVCEVLRSLSRGTRESEQEVPMLSLEQLAAPRRLLRASTDDEEAAETDELTPEDIESILYHNQFSLPMVNPNEAPMQIGNDFTRSGLWLLPVFVNHACLPNVQRTIVLDCLFLRACRDLKAGEELYDCYIETLQPIWRRRQSLATYGIVPNCERSLVEEAVLASDANFEAEVKTLQEEAAALTKSGAEGAELADRAEAVATKADVIVARALEAGLRPESALQKLSSLRHYKLPEKPISAQRMALLRGGFERCDGAAEEVDFARQEALQGLLLGSLANVLRAYAMSLKGLNRYVDAAGAWSRVLDALEQVIPCSELAAVVGSEMLSSKLLAFHLDYKSAAQKELRRALLRNHQAYSGGATVWRLLNEKLFAPSVLLGGEETWAAMQKDTRGLAVGALEDGYDPKALAVAISAAPPVREDSKPGFEELLRRRAGKKGKEDVGKEASPASRSPASSSTAASTSISRPKNTPQATSTPNAQATSTPTPKTTSLSPQTASTPTPQTTSTPTPQATATFDSKSNAASSSPSCTSAAGCEVSTSADPDGGPHWVTAVVSLPGLASASEADLEVSEAEIRVQSLRADLPHCVRASFPVPVDPASSAAKWSRRSQQLTVRLRAAT